MISITYEPLFAISLYPRGPTALLLRLDDQNKTATVNTGVTTTVNFVL